MELAQALREWHDFYLLGGTASATLIGLMFVAASIGASFITDQHVTGFRLFVTPTVVHFGAALILCLFVTVPSQTWTSLGASLLAGSVGGLGYSSWVSIDMRQWRLNNQEVELADRLWYALTPVAGYLMVMAAAIALLARRTVGLDLLASALGLLLLLGLRNAWDMMVWMVIRAPTK